MKISFLIAAIVLHSVRFVLSVNDIQVGTVLFTHKDLLKKCWSEREKALLRARSIMQDVLPQPNCIDFSESNVVEALLEYFQTCYDIISKSTCGKAQKLMYLALSDAIGGYLRAYALPLTKASFYSGKIKYQDASRLFSLYNDIKRYLKTDGCGWSPPRVSSGTKVCAKPITIKNAPKEEACSKLFLIESKYVDEKEPENFEIDDFINYKKCEKDKESENNKECKKDQGGFSLNFGQEFYDDKPVFQKFEDIDYDYETDDKNDYTNTNDTNDSPFSFFSQNVLKKDVDDRCLTHPRKTVKYYESSDRLSDLGRKKKTPCKHKIDIRPKAKDGIIEFPRRKSFRRQNRKRLTGRKLEKLHEKLQKDFGDVMKQISKNNERVGLNDFGGDYQNDEVFVKKTTNETKCAKAITKRKCSRLCKKIKNFKKKRAQNFRCFTVPLPVLEDSKKPHTIAVPFKHRPLRNIKTRSSAFVLQRYYIQVVKCINSRPNSRNHLKNFNYEFYSWLTTEVFPHLSDEEWYPAFGGVHRVTETIREYGAEPAIFARDLSRDIGYIFPNGIPVEDDKYPEEYENIKVTETELPLVVDDVENGAPIENISHMTPTIVFVVLIIFLIGCLCFFCLTETYSHTHYYYDDSMNVKQKIVDTPYFFKNSKKSDINLNCSLGGSYELFHTDSKGNFKTPYTVYTLLKDDAYKQKKTKKEVGDIMPQKRRMEGNVCNLISKAIASGNQTTSSVSFWPYQTSNIKFPEIKLPVKPSATAKANFFKDKLQNVWKNSSLKFNKIRRKKEQSTSTSHTESSPQYGQTSSQTSQSTQVSTRESSTTSQLYDEIGRRKLTPKSYTESETTESESEREGSSTESDDSRN